MSNEVVALANLVAVLVHEEPAAGMVYHCKFSGEVGVCPIFNLVKRLVVAAHLYIFLGSQVVVAKFAWIGEEIVATHHAAGGTNHPSGDACGHDDVAVGVKNTGFAGGGRFLVEAQKLTIGLHRVSGYHFIDSKRETFMILHRFQCVTELHQSGVGGNYFYHTFWSHHAPFAIIYHIGF